MTLQTRAQKRNSCLIWAIIITFVAAFIAVICFILFGDDSSSSSSSSTNKYMAYSFAEDFVKKQLKSPSTAKFPRTSEKLSI